MLPRLRTSGRVREDAHLTVFTVFGVLPTIPSCSHLEFIVARTVVWNFQEDGLLHILHCNPTELNSRSRTQNLLLLPPECSSWPPRQPSSSNITGNMFISSGKQITMNQIRSGRGSSAPSFWEELLRRTWARLEKMPRPGPWPALRMTCTRVCVPCLLLANSGFIRSRQLIRLDCDDGDDEFRVFA